MKITRNAFLNNKLLELIENQKEDKVINIHKILNNFFTTDSRFLHHLSTPLSHKHLHAALIAKINTEVIASINEFDIINIDKTRILIAEDNKSSKFLLKKILKDKYDFEFANNVQEAVNILKENDLDLILMDILMSVMDGHEATREIRSFNKTIPILAFTVNNLENDREKCLASANE